MKQISKWLASGLVVGCLWIALGSQGLTTNAAVGTAQDPASLDRRISMLEQRFFLLETSIRRLEQQVNLRPSTMPEPQRTDTTLLQTEIEKLKGHVQVLDCAVAKLDERTLAANLRQSSEENSFKDPCRMNPQNPLRLPARP